MRMKAYKKLTHRFIVSLIMLFKKIDITNIDNTLSPRDPTQTQIEFCKLVRKMELKTKLEEYQSEFGEKKKNPELVRKAYYEAMEM